MTTTLTREAAPAVVVVEHGPPRRARTVMLGTASLWVILTLLIIAPVVCFLLLATSPRLFHQGAQYFTLHYFAQAFSGATGQGIVNSLWVSALVSVTAVGLATVLAWLIQRTNVYGRRVWTVLMWVLFLVPTWMMTLSWGDLLQPYGVASAMGLNTNWIYGEFFGPLGVVIVLTTAALPFAYFVVSAGLQGLGSEFEDAARIHGAGRLLTLRTVVPIIAPALLSALAISFAETMSDFGVAFTLGYHSHFQLATYTLFNAISNFPANFPVAAVIALVLILATIPPILLQSRVMRRRSYAVLSGRTRQARRREFRPAARVGTTLGVASFFLVALGVPILGSVAGSFVQNLGIYSTSPARLSLTFYHEVFHPSITGKSLGAPLWLSNQLGVIVATATVALSLILAKRLVANTGGWSQRVTDVFLLGSVAVPGVVLGVGYIFFYNLDFITHHVINLYKTLPLLMLALIASSLPGQSRFMAGPVSQIQPTLVEAARVHGASRIRSWRTTNLPLVSRVLLWGWLLTFTKTIAELAIAQILYPPSQEPVSVTIQAYLGNFQLGTGTAMTVITLGEMLVVIAVALGLYRALTPRGWRRIGWSEVRG
ncbi:MAG TPA: iron ABC transporter permease [Acidimicrobiales bacterium]|nr:iron ABC transporter permease [Acidimicrobiales bacterium]